MRILIKSFLFGCFLGSAFSYADQPPLTVTESDGSPTGVATKIKFSNGTVTKNGSVFTVNNSASSGSVVGSTGSIGISLDGGGSAILAGSTRSITVPYACTISSWSIVADQSGSLGVHISSSSFLNYPTLSNMVGTGNGPTLSSQVKNAATPSGWNSTTISQGTVISFVIDSASTITWANIVLWLIKS